MIKEFLERCHEVWPTNNNINHNIILPNTEEDFEEEDAISVIIFTDNKWYSFVIAEGDLKDIDKTIADMQDGIAAIN